jgi:hypothetical protein
MKATTVETANTEAHTMKPATTETSTVETTTAPTVAASTAAVGSRRPCRSQGDRDDAHQTQQFKLFHTLRSLFLGLGAKARLRDFAVLLKS